MEELGGQLSVAKLAAVELREAADNAQNQGNQEGNGATWANDRLATHCKGCSREFNIARRKVIKLFNCEVGRVSLVLYPSRFSTESFVLNRLPVIILDVRSAPSGCTMLSCY